MEPGLGDTAVNKIDQPLLLCSLHSNGGDGLLTPNIMSCGISGMEKDRVEEGPVPGSC